MVCCCGHRKSKHGRMNDKHDGSCSFRTHFTDRPNIFCACVRYDELPLIRMERENVA